MYYAIPLKLYFFKEFPYSKISVYNKLNNYQIFPLSKGLYMFPKYSNVYNLVITYLW